MIKALTNPIYHYVKGFYHEHKNHTDDCDSILDAYVCTKESDSQISSPDNKRVTSKSVWIRHRSSLV